MSEFRLGVDVGGTFTDLVAIGGGRVITAKVPSTPADQSKGVVDAIEASGLDADAISALAHGMTVATNALLERAGAKIALITTEGFRDILEIGRQNRPALYDLTQRPPEPLVAREHRFTVRERTGRDGVITPLDEASVDVAIEAIRAAGDIEAVAICLLFSFEYPEHEIAVAERVAAALPDLHISRSSAVLPEFREYERFATTTANAYLSPRLNRYLDNLARHLESAGLPEPTVMQSSGGVIDIASAAANAAKCVLSGPAGGVVGAAWLGQLSGEADMLTFDMGGTSTDVAPIANGEAPTTTDSIVAGVPIKLPMVNVHTVSAGGGSIAWADAGGALRVGPASAGAEPGPAAYDLGGERATVTDANVFMGHIANGTELGGRVVISRERAAEALEHLGSELSLDAEATARGIIDVANTEMANALRVISVARGVDPRDNALMAYGGAGPLHACALAEQLGMTKILVPRASGVLSALGLAVSDVRRDLTRPVLSGLDAANSATAEALYDDMIAEACAELDQPDIERTADLRYRGQSFELGVAADDWDALAERFHDAHETRYGYAMRDDPIELVNLRVTARVAVDKPELSEAAPEHEPEADTRAVLVDGDWRDIPVYAREELGRGSRVVGPAIVEFAETTCMVRPNWHGEIDAAGTLILEHSA
ncbi:hydantoinase/oxoprolinase family protein [Salinisphaera hydrothermalis]|uniref:5-oxoprolinase n=1 Tax=Salinisphaera hydrothermalis (strain C41B8) TaxID=1304275 RepID=A0A084INY2_SALHC|nr:hydantoinase/oxoprolinase family protein [Salinisphaera hydrothermalis]KEZ78416.1 5-oxoprolinase [Salinisphaera hydrothermalis C41B8]